MAFHLAVTGCIGYVSYLLEIHPWSGDGTLRTWDRGGNELAQFVGHASSMVGTLLLDGETILSWSSDNMLRTWDRGGNELWG